MPSQYFMVEDFAAGIDLRKSSVTAKPGTLRILRDGLINAGGEIEKRRRMTLLETLPAGTFGLAGINNRLYTFGIAPGIAVPLPFVYQQLVPNPALPGGVTIERVLDVDVFQNNLFVSVRFTDGNTRQFFNGAQVTNGNSKGHAFRTHKSKIYGADNNILRFSAVNDPLNFTSGGAGFIDVTTQSSGAPELVGIEEYYSNLAVLGRRSVQIWMMDPDPAKNQHVQTMNNIGLVAPNAVASYGSGDVLFLSDTGIRSIKARDASNAAVLNDIGSPIDSLISARRLPMSALEAEKIRALVDPLSGHFWMVWGDQVYVLSYYPATRVSAWSTFTLPFMADYATPAGSRVAFRAGNSVYVYGAVTDKATALDTFNPAAVLAGEYDATSVIVEMPYLDGGKPATKKQFKGIDFAFEGDWQVFVNPDPLAPGVWQSIGYYTKTTYSLERIPLEFNSTHLALRFESRNQTGIARLGAIAVHVQMAGSD